MSVFITFLLLLCTSIFSSVCAEPVLYRNWFPAFSDYFKTKVSSICHSAYHAYLTTSTCPSCPIKWPPLGAEGRSSVNLVDCLLANTEEFMKANIGVGTVILGLLPTVLSFSGSTTTEVGLLALRRPVLASMLALSSPSIWPIRALDFDDPLATIDVERVPFKISTTISSAARYAVISAVEYALVLAAMANVGTQTWALCIRSPSALGPGFPFYPLFWPLTTLVMHILGAVHVSLRVQLIDNRAIDKATTANTLKERAKERASMEFSTCASHSRTHKAVLHPPTLTSTFLAWLASVLTIGHVMYGTAVLSSLVFVAASDAIFVGLRLWASAVLARLVVMFELSGLAVSVRD